MKINAFLIEHEAFLIKMIVFHYVFKLIFNKIKMMGFIINIYALHRKTNVFKIMCFLYMQTKNDVQQKMMSMKICCNEKRVLTFSEVIKINI